MKEIVWIFGTSGSGKETFIKSVLQDTNLQEKFGWKDKVIKVCKSSIENIGQFENDPIVNNRDSIINDTRALLVDADVILIKWQLVDSDANRLWKLKEIIPDAVHKIIRLQASEPELIDRLRHKAWWHDYGKEKAFIESELKEVKRVVLELSTSFEVTNILSDSNSHYEVKF